MVATILRGSHCFVQAKGRHRKVEMQCAPGHKAGKEAKKGASRRGVEHGEEDRDGTRQLRSLPQGACMASGKRCAITDTTGGSSVNSRINATGRSRSPTTSPIRLRKSHEDTTSAYVMRFRIDSTGIMDICGRRNNVKLSLVEVHAFARGGIKRGRLAYHWNTRCRRVKQLTGV
ncbi:uncharacterized protein LY89DRAFT_262961 [Mollisia scopiformis]|uniref:Uncharacterized protein n=1 Tax=Mollisia scopiformis TaxID=149040 RepID=A0A132BDQ3_MOLSC|nr:uncharacterized protein LY89DRAFT_262961 [Mollisia scopiformis]KUJ10508.1 hypothetical protein LY89DRAFT_262961 [Mollisia scopiformis]